MLSDFLYEFLRKTNEDNIIHKAFKNRFEDILNTEKKHEATDIIREELKTYIEKGEYSINEDLNIDKYSNITSKICLYEADRKVFLSKIFVSGIKGIKYYKDDDCKERTTLNLKGNKSALIFGWNGDGKSSLLEGIEFGLTGNVEEAERRNLSRDLGEYLTNNFCDRGIVKIELHNPSNPPKLLEIKRDTNYKFTITNNQEAEDLVEELKDNVDEFENYYNKVFIERNRIEEFVTSKGKAQINRYEELIGLNEINEFINDKWKTWNAESNNVLYNENNNKQIELEKLKNDPEIKNKDFLLKAEDFTDEEMNIIKNCNDRLASKFNSFSKKDYSQIKENDYDDIINEIEILQDEKNYYEKLISASNHCRKIIHLNKIIDEISEKLNTNQKHLLEMYKAALEIINEEDEKCPLCKSEYYGEELISEIKERKNLINKKDNEFERLEKVLKEKEAEKMSYKANLEKLLNEFDFELENAQINFNEIEFILERISEKLNEHDNLDFSSELLEKIIEKIKSKKNKYKSLRESLKTDREKLIKKVEEEKLINDRKNRVKEDFKNFHNKLEEFRKEYLFNQLKELSDDIKGYYNKFVEDNHFLNLKLKKSNNKIQYLTDLDKSDELKEVDPLSILSEGQLRCFGLSILFAINKRINSDFIILDDIVNAIDIEHRYNILNFIINDISSNERQYIITTHDKLFREKLINMMPKGNLIDLYVFNNKNLIEKSNNNDSFESKVEKAIKEDDFRTAIVYMRIILENNIYQIAEQKGVKIAFKDKRYKYSLKSIFGEVKKEQEVLEDIYNEIAGSDLCWGVLNQENHFWSENNCNLNKNFIADLFKKIKAVKSFKEFLNINEIDRRILIDQKNDSKPDVSNIENKRILKNKDFININEGESITYEWGNNFNRIKDWL